MLMKCLPSSAWQYPLWAQVLHMFIASSHTQCLQACMTHHRVSINIYWALSHLRTVDSHVLSPFLTGTRPISCPLRALVLSVFTHLVATLVTGLHAVQAHIVLPLSWPAVSLVEFFNFNYVTLMINEYTIFGWEKVSTGNFPLLKISFHFQVLNIEVLWTSSIFSWYFVITQNQS